MPKSKPSSRKASDNLNRQDHKTLSEIIGEIDFKNSLSKKDVESIRRNSAVTSRTQRTNSESMLNQKRERTKMLKPKVIIQEDGNVVVEKAKLSEVNEKLASTTQLTAIQEEKEKLTSLSFKKKLPFKKWSKEETDLFYKGLECFGTDFSLFSYVFPGRSRNQLKNKLHKEENMNSEKIKAHLLKFDKEKLSLIIPLIISNKEEIRKRENDFRKILLNDSKKIVKESYDEDNMAIDDKERKLMKTNEEILDKIIKKHLK